jgi:hypothetical protein
MCHIPKTAALKFVPAYIRILTLGKARAGIRGGTTAQNGQINQLRPPDPPGGWTDCFLLRK